MRGHRSIDLPKLTAGKIAAALALHLPLDHGIQGSTRRPTSRRRCNAVNQVTAGQRSEAVALIKRQLESSV